MATIKVYELDGWSVLVRSVEVNSRDAIGFPFTLTAPPVLEEGQFARFSGSAWEVLAVHPKADAPQEQEPHARLRVVVTDVQADAPMRSLSIRPEGVTEVTLQVGSRITITAEMRSGAELIVRDDEFRMPLVSRDGRERVVLATMVAGIITISALLDDSRVWNITQDMINVDLPPEQQLDFGGFRIFAVE